MKPNHIYRSRLNNKVSTIVVVPKNICNAIYLRLRGYEKYYMVFWGLSESGKDVPIVKKALRKIIT